MSAAVLVFMPAHLMVTQVGATDHHAAEVLLSTAAYALFISSLRSGRMNDITYTNLRDRDRMIVRPLIYAALSGVFLILAVITWAGSPIFIGLIFLYLPVQFSLDLKTGRSSQYLFIIGMCTYLTTLILSVPVVASTLRPGLEMSPMFLSWFHVTYVAIILVGIGILGSMATYFHTKDIDWWKYPTMVATLAVFGLLMMKFTTPNVYQNIAFGINYLLGRGEILGQISEASPLFFAVDGSFTLVNLWEYFGLCTLVALIAAWMIVKRVNEEQYPAELTFFIVWTVVITLLTISQSRFAYLLSINVSILSGYLIMAIYTRPDHDRSRSSKRGSSRSNIPLIIVMLLFIPSIYTGISLANNPSMIPSDWDESVRWLDQNTPKTSFYDEPTEQAEYGIMSWWDYGNWILYTGYRPVVANNFQTGVKDAADFFISSDENTGNEILDVRNVRYVITDIEMVKTKFSNIAQLSGEKTDSYYDLLTTHEGSKTIMRKVENDKFKQTMLAQLHVFDGVMLDHFRLVYESNTTVTTNPDVKYVKIFEYVKGAHLVGQTTPGDIVHAAVLITSNRERRFEYHNTAIADDDGWYEIIVPYATTNCPYDTAPADVIRVWSENGDQIVEVSISENEIVNGDTIHMIPLTQSMN